MTEQQQNATEQAFAQDQTAQSQPSTTIFEERWERDLEETIAEGEESDDSDEESEL